MQSNDGAFAMDDRGFVFVNVPFGTTSPTNPENPENEEREDTVSLFDMFRWIRSEYPLQGRRRHVVEALSRYIESKTTSRCRFPLSLRLFEDDPQVESNGSLFSPFDANQYLVLAADGLSQSGRLEALSMIGLNTEDPSVGIEIDSETPVHHRMKKYNTILRAAAVIVAWADEMKLTSITTNPISAYSLLSRYATEFTFYKNGVPEVHNHTEALGREEAEGFSSQYQFEDGMRVGGVSEVAILPTEYNLAAATQALAKTVVATIFRGSCHRRSSGVARWR